MNGITSEQEFKFRGVANRSSEKQNANDAALESCTICLQPITERAVAVPCNHLSFDFICLISWLQEQPRCPLCKAVISQVQYDWRSPDDFKTFHVAALVKPEDASGSQYQNPRSHLNHNILAQRQFLRRRRHQYRAETPPAGTPDPALARRRAVYQNRQYSLRVGANRISAYRDFTPADVAENLSLQSRARAFLRRELQVFHFLDDDEDDGGGGGGGGGNTVQRRRTTGKREFVLEYTVALLRTHELKGADGAMETLMGEMLGEANARLLLHELEAWLRSPYESLGAWDAHVQYAQGRRHLAGGVSGRMC